MKPTRIDEAGRKFYNLEDESGYKMDRTKSIELFTKLIERYCDIADDSFEPIYGDISLEQFLEDILLFVQHENYLWAEPL